MNELIRQVLADHAGLRQDAAALDDGADLYRAGLTSHASITVMLALEDEFDVEFPDSSLRKSTFASVRAIRETLISLGVSENAQVAG